MKNLSALDFCNSPVWNIEFDELDFFPSLNCIFLPPVACKIQVWNRLKIHFIELNISNWRIAKIKCRKSGKMEMNRKRCRWNPPNSTCKPFPHDKIACLQKEIYMLHCTHAKSGLILEFQVSVKTKVNSFIDFECLN